MTILFRNDNPVYSNHEEGRLAIWVAKKPVSDLILGSRLNGGVYRLQGANEFEPDLLTGMGAWRSICFENENIIDSIGQGWIFLFLRRNKQDCPKSTPLVTPFTFFCFGRPWHIHTQNYNSKYQKCPNFLIKCSFCPELFFQAQKCPELLIKAQKCPELSILGSEMPVPRFCGLTNFHYKKEKS